MNPIPEWQQRVLDEVSELEARLAKLNEYLSKPVDVISGSPSAEHRSLLVQQRDVMNKYADKLRERIALFPQLS